MLKIPRIIHEQNAEFGIANDISRHFCNMVCLTFPIEKVKNKKNYVVTGNMLRPQIELYRKSKKPYLQRRLVPLRLLVYGGSQGAVAINTVILDAVGLLPEDVRKKIALYHIIGAKSEEEMFKTAYEEMGIEYHVWRFLSDIGRIYSITDLAIARAGAGTVTELIEFGIPAIFIPYPHAGSHQLKNAQVIAKKGGAIIIEEKALDPVRIKDIILDIIVHSEKCFDMHKALVALKEDLKKEKMKDVIVGLIKK
jgi:UDP-N-acetylglucosamine--N-acetylmuramyl-(pentapeptide) pyrophosphoryl-undecaprenol N-acetylglucosamine transferase